MSLKNTTQNWGSVARLLHCVGANTQAFKLDRLQAAQVAGPDGVVAGRRTPDLAFAGSTPGLPGWHAQAATVDF